jgi:AcrR family transcriptional regulator
MQVTPAAPASRREQILRATIEVVAGAGYHEASFAKIIEHAGLSSTRLISYHFESRDALMREALGYVIEQGRAFMLPRIGRAGPARTRLAAYIRSNLEFLAERPAYARAAVIILANLPAPPPGEIEGAQEGTDEAVTALEQLFTAAQEAGEMRRFDPVAMAVSLRAAIDAAAGRSVAQHVDLRKYAEELVEIFDRATAAEVAS